MVKKNQKSPVRKNKAELVIVILASAAALLTLGICLLYQQKELLSQENYTLEQQFVDQNSQIQYMQQKMKTMEVTTTPTRSY